MTLGRNSQIRVRFERRKVDKSKTHMINETCKLYSRDPSLELGLYRFKDGAFWRHSVIRFVIGM